MGTRGFLHGFAVPEQSGQAVFEYMCDNVYDHSSEFSVAPRGYINYVSNDAEYANIFKHAIFSEKDNSGLSAGKWLADVLDEYNRTGKPWYE